MPREDVYGSKGRKKRVAWGSGDKAGRDRQREYNKRKEEEKQNKFGRWALAQDHPQQCAVCMDDLKTHLVSDCGNTDSPFHRHHGFCEDCARGALERGRCPLCRGQVNNITHVGVSFFA